MKKIKIGILDFGYRKKNTSGVAVLKNVFDYSTMADELGFSSYWLSEHHNSGHGWSNPEMLLPLLAGNTNKINIGIAGILLAVHSPYRVALNFKLLENMFPGRIDLGLANGSIELPYARKLLSNNNVDANYRDYFDPKVSELIKFLENDKNLWENEKTFIPPYGGLFPRVWKLSNSFNGLQDCLQKKMHLCRSTFHDSSPVSCNKNEIIEFRSNFFRKYGTQPKINIAVSGICEKETRLAKRTYRQLGLKNLHFSANLLIGSPSFFKDELLKMEEQSSINEFIFYDQSTNLKKRMQALELMAKEFDLN